MVQQEESGKQFLFFCQTFGKIHLFKEEHTENIHEHKGEQYGPPNAETSQICEILEEPDHGQAQTPQAHGGHHKGIVGLARAVEEGDIALEDTHKGLSEDHEGGVLRAEEHRLHVVGQERHSLRTEGEESRAAHDGDNQGEIAAATVCLQGTLRVAVADVLSGKGSKNTA